MRRVNTGIADYSFSSVLEYTTGASDLLTGTEQSHTQSRSVRHYTKTSGVAITLNLKKDVSLVLCPR